MPTTTVLPFPPVLTLIPLREFHIQHGKGRTVAVLFRVAVNHAGRPHGSCHQAGRGHQPMGCIGAQE